MILPPATFSRAQRLDGPHAYAAVFAFKCGGSGKFFRVYAKPNAYHMARLGVVVSKRIEPRAVARNKGKRLVREVFRQLRTQLSAVDLVVRPNAPVLSAQRAAAREELQELLLQAARRCGQRHASPEPDRTHG